MKLLDGIFKNAEIANFKNPFTQGAIKRIQLEWERKIFTQNYFWSAVVWFEKGDTSGRQKFENTELQAILKEIEIFVKSLEI